MEMKFVGHVGVMLLLMVVLSALSGKVTGDMDPKPLPVYYDVDDASSETSQKVSDDISDVGIVLHTLRSGKRHAGFVHAFVAAVCVIIVSELGDKTFFIAAIMAMRHSRVTVFTGAVLALGLMTVLAAVVGFATTVIPRDITHYASAIVILLFGIKMLKEGYEMSPEEGQHEYDEVQADLDQMDAEKENLRSGEEEHGAILPPKRKPCFGIGGVFIQAFTLILLAEWGDRSQIATITLGAREDVFGVIVGCTLGHAFCTGLAVIGGRIVAQKISVRTVTLIGGIVYLVFAITAFAVGPY